MSIQMPLHRVIITFAGDSNTQIRYPENPVLKVEDDDIQRQIINAASCISEDGHTDCKTRLGVKKYNGVFNTTFHLPVTDQINSKEVSDVIVQRDDGNPIMTYRKVSSKSKVKVYTIPRRWWLLLSPHTWLEHTDVDVTL